MAEYFDHIGYAKTLLEKQAEVNQLRRELAEVAAQRDEWHRQNGLLRGERDQARAELAERWNAAEYVIGVDAADDSHDWVYVLHRPCETDVYSGRDDHELYTADRLVEAMMAHRCEATANLTEPRRLEYPMGG